MTAASRRLLVRTAAACIVRFAPRVGVSLPGARPGFIPPSVGSCLASHLQRGTFHPSAAMVLTRSRASASSSSYSSSAADSGSRNGDQTVGNGAAIQSFSGSRPLPDFSAFLHSEPPAGGASQAANAAWAVTPVVTPAASDDGVVDAPSRGTPRRPGMRRNAVRPRAVKPKLEKASSGSGGSTSTENGSTENVGSRASFAPPSKDAEVSLDSVAGTPTKTKRKSSAKGPGKKGGASGSKSGGSPKKRQRIEPGSLTPPEGWEDVYELVRELRSDRSAPVDTDGGHALPERDLGEDVRRFQVLIALMLSSQTKDAVVGETMRALQRHGLTVGNIRDTSHEDLNKLIRKVGFHNNKTKYIKKACDILAEQYGGDIPPTAKEMMDLPGVGPKMAYIIECEAFGITTGIGVDTHMHRMFNDLGWVKSTNPEGTREQLEGWLPRDKWAEVNVLWVGIGQETQQQKEKALRKALECSRPADALRLMRRLGLNVDKEAKRFGLKDEVERAMSKCK